MDRWAGEPPSSGAELARSAPSRPLRLSWPLLPAQPVDTDSGHARGEDPLWAPGPWEPFRAGLRTVQRACLGPLGTAPPLATAPQQAPPLGPAPPLSTTTLGSPWALSSGSADVPVTWSSRSLCLPTTRLNGTGAGTPSRGWSP